jgi:1-deoxy-D-xylulose-5-phosphate reductoisomerase
MPATLNAANEIAVQAFLDGKVKFGDIARINRTVMDEHTPEAASSLDTILAADSSARRRATDLTAQAASAA